MKIALINPRLKTWSPNVYAPLGLCYLASVLENVGHTIDIIDMNSHKISDDELSKRLLGVDIIGITGMITEYKEVVRVSTVARIATPTSKIILGGPLATTHTREVLLSSQANYVVMGEGEITIVELVAAIEQESDCNDILGVALRRGDEVWINAPREPIENLDDIFMPARYLLDMGRYTSHHFKSFGLKLPKIKSCTMITSRGCPYSCSFCFKDVWGKKWRGRSAENIIHEVKYLLNNYDYKGFVFNDDTFVMDKQRVLDFCKLIIENRLDIKWYCNGRVNLMNEIMIKAMSRSGCTGIAYGIEAGNQQTLDTMKKGITLEQVRRVVALTKKYGIHITGYFMLGNLGETRADIYDTINFARELDLDFYGFTMTSPILGTPMYEAAKSSGIIIQEDLDDWSYRASVNMTKDCSTKELEHINELAFREFTLAKRYGKKYLLNPHLWLDGLRSVIFLYGKRDFTVLIKKAWDVVRGK